MAELGTNAIRVYHVDPKANHDGCMEALAGAGIYLFVDLDTFDTSIRQVCAHTGISCIDRANFHFQDNPQWTHSQFARYKAVLDEFQKYNNTAGVFIGNEVINTREGSAAAPHLLAAALDIKSYRNEKGYRNIPVGYSAADIAELRPMLQNYLACRPDPSDRLDFFSLNAYEWCGPTTYERSGYKTLQTHANDYPIPIFFSETGCNVARPRTFEDQAAIFGPEMSNTWSGSIVYEWIQETNDYGLINYGPPPGASTAKLLVQDGFTRQGEPTPVAPDFHNLRAQWATLKPTGVALSDYIKSTSTIKPASCPASTPGGWAVDANLPLPTLGQKFHQPAPGATAACSDSDSGSGIDSGSRLGYFSARVTSVAPSNYQVKSTVNGVSASGMGNSDGLAGVSLFLCLSISALTLWLW
jgi:hypothetical protein